MKSKITYFFINGRIERINSSESFPEEMFYGYNFLRKTELDVEIVESKKSFFREFIQKNIEDKLSYKLQIPLFFSYYLTFKNILLFTKSKHVIMTNHRVGSSLLPLIFISKLLFNKPLITIFIMGLFKKKPKNNFLLAVKEFLIKYLFKNSENIYFLGLEEFNYAKNNYGVYLNKFKYYPFSVDLEFWSAENNEKKDQVLFVGNDGNRDYEFLVELVKDMPNQNFVILSNQLENDILNLPNCKLINGSFAKQGLSDIELKNLYNESIMTIIPLKNSIQPSGQSVALQSMACGTPIVITETFGFWDKKNFQNKKNIYFASENKFNIWDEQIKNIKKLKQSEYDSLTKNSIELLKMEYNLENFHNSFLKEILDKN